MKRNKIHNTETTYRSTIFLRIPLKKNLPRNLRKMINVVMYGLQQIKLVPPTDISVLWEITASYLFKSVSCIGRVGKYFPDDNK